MSNGGSSNNNVAIVAILAVLVLASVAAWFIWGRPGSPRVAPPTTSGEPAGTDVNVKVNLPDTVTINP